jgi:hypothetical protein
MQNKFITLRNNKPFIYHNFKQFCNEIEFKNINVLETLKNINGKKIQQILSSIESKSQDNKYNLSKVPDPNCFGDALVYLAPFSLMNSYTKFNYDKNSLPLLAGITFLSNIGIMLSSSFLTPYFNAVICLAFLKSINHVFYKLSIYQIKLINECEVKIIYISGETDKVHISDIKLISNLNNSDTNKGIYDLTLQVKNEIKPVFLRLRSLDAVCFAEIETLFSVISPKIHTLSSK